MITSAYVTSASFSLVINDINVESLSSPNSPDWWRNRTEVLTVFRPLYSTVDVTVSMGDGHDCTFSTSNTSHSDAGCEFTMTTTANDVSLLLKYEYETWGVYNLELSATNGITAYDVTAQTTVEVLEWTCDPPVVTFSDIFTVEPFQEIEVTSVAAIAPEVVQVQCMKSPLVTYVWSLFDSTGNDLTGNVTPQLMLDSDQLHLPYRMSLTYATYTAEVRVSMVIDELVFGASDSVFTQSEARFRYVRSDRIDQLETQGKRLKRHDVVKIINNLSYVLAGY